VAFTVFVIDQLEAREVGHVSAAFSVVVFVVFSTGIDRG
jgi:hypothetical protein